MAIDCLSVGILVADHLCSPVDRLPAAGELVLADELPLAIGGCAANAAIDLARLGVNVGAVGCVGNDSFGDFIIDTLARHDVDASAVQRRPGIGTSGTLIINVKGQDRRFIHAVGANAAFGVRDISLDLVRQAKVLYLGGYLLMPSLTHDDVAKLFQTARSYGVTTVLDVVLPGPGDHFSGMEKVLAQTDVFLPNEDEAAALTGLSDPVAQAQRFREAGASTVVITCGDAGSVLLANNLRLRSGTYPVDFVGGTGSGDAFDAGYIAGLLGGDEPRRCLEWASALGASCVRSVGATDAVFHRDEALDFMRRHKLAIEDI